MSLGSSCTIGGIVCYVDPDVSGSVKPYVRITPALDGTIFVNFLARNYSNPASQEDLSFNGVYETNATTASFKALARNKSPVTVANIPGVSSSDVFVITNFQFTPIKPKVVAEGETDLTAVLRFNFSMSLQRVNSY